jgi:hypothetical protein
MDDTKTVVDLGDPAKMPQNVIDVFFGMTQITPLPGASIEEPIKAPIDEGEIMHDDIWDDDDIEQSGVASATPFVIDCEDKADWAIGKLAAIRAEQDRIRTNSAKRIEELDADYNKFFRKFGEALEMFARSEAQRRKRRTVTLMQGSLVLRASASRTIVADKVAALEIARTLCPEAIKTKITESVDSKEFLRAAEEEKLRTGEVFDCIAVIPPGESFSITFPSSDTKPVTAVAQEGE